MPTYHYRCAACGHAFDIFQKFSEDALTDCPECGGAIRRVPQPVGIVFKGSGWYITDSRSGKAGSQAKKSENGSKSEGGKAADKPASESKAAATPAKDD